jgi:hypothetical protein
MGLMLIRKELTEGRDPTDKLFSWIQIQVDIIRHVGLDLIQGCLVAWLWIFTSAWLALWLRTLGLRFDFYLKSMYTVLKSNIMCGKNLGINNSTTPPVHFVHTFPVEFGP